MVGYILTIPSGVKKIWDRWNIRGAILFSLLLQIVLIFLGPIRKSTRRKLAILLIWFTYLLADAAANFTIGLICHIQYNQHNKLSNQTKVEESSDMLAFWVPFLLLHLGGPDTITAFSLEDNQLWLRHLLSFVFQATNVFYVFYRSLPNENLWIPTVLIITAGMIKYVERTRAFFLASLDKFRDSVLKHPDPGPNYSKLMDEYSLGRYKPVRRETSNLGPDDLEKESPDLSHLEVVYYAYRYFQIFKGLVVDLILTVHQRKRSSDFFFRRKAEDALKVIEVELNFLYEAFYTKSEVVHSTIGYIFRFLAFGSVMACLGFFYFQAKKDEYQEIDIAITYTLLLGAIALDVIAFLMIIFSDRTFVSIFKSPISLTSPDFKIDIFRKIFALNMPMWLTCHCKATGYCVPHSLLVTPFPFRRWSGSVSAHNLIRRCLKSNMKKAHESTSLWKIMFEKIHLFLMRINEVGGRLKKITLPVTEILDEMMYVSSEPLTKELWEFIFKELKTKSTFADSPDAARIIFSMRGEWTLMYSLPNYRKLLKYVSDVPYDESLLLWHIATDLCYHGPEPESLDYREYREFSKILSDYMIYLLLFQPTMMSLLAGIGKIRYRDTYAEAEKFFKRMNLGPNEDKRACNEILSVNTDVEPAIIKGKRSKSVLFDASILAKELNLLTDDKWSVISGVWVELVSYAANHCKASTHVEQLSKGGELITFFWLLMANLGFGEQFETSKGCVKG